MSAAAARAWHNARESAEKRLEREAKRRTDAIRGAEKRLKRVLENEGAQRGELSVEELRKHLEALMTKAGARSGVDGARADEDPPPNLDEARWIMDEVNDIGEAENSLRQTITDVNQLFEAERIWTEHCETRKEIIATIDRYDVNKDGCLDLGELQKMLTELNGNDPVPEDVAREVIAHVDGIRSGVETGAVERSELEFAVNYFKRTYCGQGKTGSACCVMM